MASKPGRIITFYSYKGGTGRSMALANIAWILASNSKRVLVVDWDLEAPGLQRYLRPFLLDRELTDSPGIVDLITDFILEAITPLENDEQLAPDWFLPLTELDPYLISLDWKFPKGCQIDFIPAGRQGPDYAMRFAAINWQKFYDVLGGGALIEELKTKMRSRYDYVLVDSRTGVSDTSGICTVQMPDSLVVCFTFNNQSIEGAAAISQGVFEQRAIIDSESSLMLEQSANSPADERAASLYKSPYQFKIFPVPMRVDQGEKEKLETRQMFARWKFDPFIERIPKADRRAYWGAVEVPYVPYFAYEEILAPFKDDPSDPKTCLAAFTRITSEITQKEVSEFHPLISPEQKQEVLNDFASIPVPATVAVAGAAANGGQKPTGTIIGGIAVAESSVEKNIRLAELTFQSLGQQEREEARRFWMRLVRVPGHGETGELNKARVSLEDLTPVARRIASIFATAELLVLNKDEEHGETIVEAAADELLRNWPRLHTWVENERLLLVWRQDLQASKARWQERNRDPGELLIGRALDEARPWYKTHREYLSDSEAVYIEASLLYDQIRRQRERSKRWLANAVRVAAVLLMVLVFAFLYTRSSNVDKAERIVATARQMIDAAKAGNDYDRLQLGLLLATEAQRLSPSSKAEALLKENLPRLPRRVSLKSRSDKVLRVALSANGSQVVAVTGRPRGNQPQPEDRAAQVQDAQTIEIITRMPFSLGSTNFTLSNDGKFLAIANKDGTTAVLDGFTGSRIFGTQHEKGSDVRDLAFSPDGRFFASAGSDKTVHIVDLRNLKGNLPFTYQASINAVTFSNNSQHLAIADDSSLVHVLSMKPGTNVWSQTNAIKLPSAAFSVSLSPSGDALATISFYSQRVGILQVSGGGRTLEHDYNVSSVSFCPEGQFIVTAGTGGNITVWDLAGKMIEKFRVEGDVDKVLFSSDGRKLAAIGNSKLARLWDYNNGHFTESAVMSQGGIINDIAFGPNNLVVTGGADNGIKVWDIRTELTGDLQRYEPCSRLTRNLTVEEWNRYLADDLGSYRATCPDIP